MSEKETEIAFILTEDMITQNEKEEMMFLMVAEDDEQELMEK